MEPVKHDKTNLKVSPRPLTSTHDLVEKELEDAVPAEKRPRQLIAETPAEEASLNASNFKADTSQAFNPTLSDDEAENIEEALKGDAIGSTLYSSRFVIATILKLRDMKAPLENDENFEKELESLWDMTVEKDVVLMLLQFDVFEIFLQSILQNANDGRLIEILAGIVGNMCSVAEEALEQLCKTEAAIDVFIQLIATEDSGVLIQLMRLYTIAFGKESSAIIWSKRIIQTDHFIDCFCFILSNSCNTSLLLHSLEALNAILAKSALMLETVADDEQITENEKENIDCLHYFLNLKLSESIKQAFLTFHAKETVYTGSGANTDDEVDEDFTESISESVQKAFIMFLNIQEIIFNYAYDDVFNEKTETELKSCLLVIISTISTPIFVLPCNFVYLQSVLEIFKEFFSVNSELHDENMACYVANMWEILRKLKIKQLTGGVASNGFDDNDDEILDEAVNESLSKLFQLTHSVLKIMLQKYNTETLEVILRRLSPTDAFKLLEAYGVALSPDYIEELHITTLHCEQLKSALSA